MDYFLIILGFFVGFVLSFLIFSLRRKLKYVAKTELNMAIAQLNETNLQLKLSDDRLSNQKSDYSNLYSKFETKELEVMTLQSKSSVLETQLKNNEEKISDLINSLQVQTNVNNALQIEINTVKQRIAEEIIKNTSLVETYIDLKEQSKKQVDQLTQWNETYLNITAEKSILLANNAALNDKLGLQKEEIIELQKKSHLQFEKLANQILEEKSEKFTASNKTNIEALLKPLGENIENFKKRVEETYDKESKQRFSLEEKVKDLIDQTNKVSAEANNLASALKGQSKKQGNWGEMILESILQQSGLVKEREYFLQQTIKDEAGKSLRPDVLVKLPDNRMIIIDSKVSLVAYDRFSAAETTDEQALHLVAHLKSIYSHIDDLHEKKYDNLADSLDFTMMFVPIEPAYLISIQSDQELWAYAYAKRILLISPTNLIACLKLMADLWKRELQSKNAMEIVKRGELLYEKFVTFASTLEDVGKHLEKSQQSYTAAIGQLNSGSGNLVGQALKLKNLGLKSSKQIPEALKPSDFDSEE
jgi:DNA recombination protein RmuC